MKKAFSHKTTFTKSYPGYNKSVQEYFDQGNTKIDQRDYKGAISDYTKAIEFEPKNIMAYYYRGSAKILIQDTKGAIDDLTKAVEISLLAKSGYFGDVAHILQHQVIPKAETLSEKS